MPNASSLSGANYTAAVLNFSKTIVISSPGKSNIAKFFPSKSAAAVSISTSSAVVEFADLGIAAESAFFSKVQIYNQAGAVVKTILPTPSCDHPGTTVFADHAEPGCEHQPQGRGGGCGCRTSRS